MGLPSPVRLLHSGLASKPLCAWPAACCCDGGKMAVQSLWDEAGRATFTFDREIKTVAVPAEKRTIRPDGHGFQEEFGKLDVRLYEVE
jgi:hypothetical protein